MKLLIKRSLLITLIVCVAQMQAMEQSSWLSQMKSASMAFLRKSLGYSIDAVKKIDRQTIEDNKKTIAVGTAAVASTGIVAYFTTRLFKQYRIKKFAQEQIIIEDANIKRYCQAYRQATEELKKCEKDWAGYEQQRGIKRPVYAAFDGYSDHRNEQIFVQRKAFIKEQHPDAYACLGSVEFLKFVEI